MRNPLNKRFPKEFKNNFTRYICIFALLFITIIVGAGFMIVMDSSIYTLDKVEKENKLENGFFEVTNKVNEDTINALENRGLKVYENFYVTDNEFDGNAKVFVFNERKEIDLPSVHEGRLPEKGSKDEIAIERIFAGNRGIKIGDKIDINGEQLEVVGLISLIDYTSLFFNNQDMVMNTNDFGVTVVSEECFDNLDQASITYRYSYRYDNADKSDKEKLEEAKEIQKILIENGNHVQNLLTAEKNQSINYLKEDMGHDGPMIKIFIYILVGIIAFIFAVLTSNTIEEEAAIIGTLRALGYRKGEIIWHYLVPTVVVAVLASGIGNLIGYTAMIEPFKGLYYTTYCLPPIEVVFNPGAFVLTTIVPVGLMIVINYAMLASKLSLSPLKFLRKDLKKKRQKRAIKLPNAKFISRFRMRVILQNKGSYLVLFFGIFLSSFLLMFGLGVEPLMNHYVDEIADTVDYGYMYMLKAPVEAEGGEKAYMYGMSTNYYFTNEDIDVTFYGIDCENTEFFKESKAKKGEVAITDSFAKKCKIGIGDEITFTDNSTEKEYRLTVSAVNSYTNNLAVYMDIEEFRELIDADENVFNTYFSDVKLDIDDAYIAKYMTRSDMLGAAKQMMASFDIIIKAFSAFSVFAYLVFLYLLTKVVIDKNSLYISFMKVFGYEKKEIRKLYLDASAIVVIVSLIVCLPIETWCFELCTVYLSSLIEGYMELYLPAYIYVELIVIGLISYFAINAIHMIKVRKIPMNEALKNRE